MSLEAAIHFILVLIVVGAIFGLLYWFASRSPMPEPFKAWLMWFIIGIGVVLIIYWVLLPLVSGGVGVPALRR